jgi:hypothetical protein
MKKPSPFRKGEFSPATIIIIFPMRKVNEQLRIKRRRTSRLFAFRFHLADFSFVFLPRLTPFSAAYKLF